MGFWKRLGVGIATGGLSEGVRAATGAESIYDPILEGAGMGIDHAGKAPNPDDYLGAGASQAKDNYLRALQVRDQAQGITARPIADPERIRAGLVNASRVEPVEHGETHDAGPVERVTAREVLDPGATRVGNLAPVERLGSFGELNAERVGPIGLQRSTVDANAGRLLTAAAEGSAPSQAAEQLKYALDQATKKRLSIAAGARGSERAGARREAMLMVGEDAASSGQQAAAARAGEMATARGQLAEHAQRTAALDAEQNRVQADLDRAIAQGNQTAANALRVRQTELEAERQKVNADAENRRTEYEASLRTGLEEAGKNRGVSVAEGNAARGLQAQEFGAGAANARAESLARRQDETDQQYLTRLLQARTANANFEQGAATGNADRTLTADTTNVGNTIRVGEFNSGQDLDVQKTRLLGAEASENLAQGSTKQTIELDKARYNAAANKHAEDVAREREQRQGRQKLAGQVFGAAIGGPAGAQIGGQVAGGGALNLPPSGPGSIAAGQEAGDAFAGAGPDYDFINDVAQPLDYSDERLKSDIRDVKPAAAHRLLHSLRAKTYRKGGREDVGVIAQDLERDPLGRKLVHEDAAGLKKVNYAGLTALLLAAVARSRKGRR